jgi:succinate-semialdehyde dehydrogenase/glutarate-semialdehyde dehydrogenase
MVMTSVNPYTGNKVKTYAALNPTQIDAVMQQTVHAARAWNVSGFHDRSAVLRRVAGHLRANQARYAGLITLEMGKPLREARGEIEKCAWACDYYAEHGPGFLADEIIGSDAGRSVVAYQPLGTVLAVMPWNFPFWQVFRCAAPTLMAGNSVLLKHASNVPQCSLAIEEIFHSAGLPENAFRSLLLDGAAAEALIGDPRIHAVSFTGSEAAGRRVAAAAGAHLKKSVLELGGSDAFVVLADADLEQAAQVGVTSRFLNAGQSCIAAKRFIVVDSIAREFLDIFRHKAAALVVGDPMDEGTHIGPMARADLRTQLHRQVTDSVQRGAQPLLGCTPLPGDGFFYAPSLLDQVRPGMPAYAEELFGPVACIIRAKDDEDALNIANDNRYGLGGSVWTRDAEKGEAYARRLQCGAAFVNGLVKSDPRLPFGGIKASGYGRELSVHGIREFVNAKTLWIK